MRVVWLILSAVIAIALELYAWRLLVVDEQVIFSNILLLHLLSSIIAGWGCTGVKIAYRDHKMVWFGFYFTMIFLMPGFAVFGVYGAILHALLYPKKQRDVLWKDVPVPDLPYQPVIVSAEPLYGEGGLSSVIQSARDVQRRVNAVVAAKQINEKMSVPLLQAALKDPEDDVRLFAYAVLDAKTTAITDRIANLLLEVKQEKGVAKSRLCYAVAQNYWELSFLGLATGNTLDFVLNEAKKFAAQAADLGWAGSDVDFLIGRILLQQKEYAKAAQHFTKSLKKGALESAILPYLAETSYEQRRFNTVRDTLKRLDQSCHGNVPIPAVVKSWGVHG